MFFVLVNNSWSNAQLRLADRRIFESAADPITGKYKCPKCKDRSFSQSYSMYRHYKYECGDVQPRYQCPVCGILSKWTHSIYNHIRKIHPGVPVRLNKLY